MAKATQINLKLMTLEVEELLRDNRDYKIIFGEFMIPSEVGGYTDNEYEVDKFLDQYLKDYHNNRKAYLDVLGRVIRGEVKNIKIIKEEELDIETLIDPDQVIDEVETIKLANGYLEEGQFKSYTDKLFIHRIKTNYIHQLQPQHQPILDKWLNLLDWMTGGDTSEQERLQLFLGSVFLVKHHERKAFSQFGLFGGASGSGKSSLFNLVARSLGKDKGVNLKLEEFSDDNKLKEAKNKLLVIDNELDSPIKGRKASDIKEASEGGQFLINSKYVEAYPMDFSGTIVIATNKPYDYIIPIEEENGLERRLQTFWFERPLSHTQQDIIGEFLGQENELVNEVILHWLVKGYTKLYKQNFELYTRVNDQDLPIGKVVEDVLIVGDDTWETFSMYHGLIKQRVRRKGERVWVVAKDPRGHFIDYVTHSEIYNKTVDEVIDLLHSKGWEEGKKIINQRILYHFNLEPKRLRRDGERIRVYQEASEGKRETLKSPAKEKLLKSLRDLYKEEDYDLPF